MKCKLGLLINLKILGIWGLKLKAEYYWCCYKRISSHSWIRSGLVSLTDVLLPPFVNKKNSKIEKFAVLQFLYRRITNYHHHYHNCYHHHHYYYYYYYYCCCCCCCYHYYYFIYSIFCVPEMKLNHGTLSGYLTIHDDFALLTHSLSCLPPHSLTILASQRMII